MRLFLCFIYLNLFFITSNVYAQARCNNDQTEPSDICSDAPMICDLLNYCNTLPFPLIPAPATICGNAISMDNPHWFRFIATSTDVSITIDPTRCTPSAGGNTGMQGAIAYTCPFRDINGYTMQTVGSCQSACSDDPFTIGTGGIFEPGREYWIMLDGCAGSICDYHIIETEGLQVPWLFDPQNIIGTETICPGSEAGFRVNQPNLANIYYWTINGVPFETPNSLFFLDIPSGFPAGLYEICLENAANDCYSLIVDNEYDPGSICKTFEVIGIPPTIIGPVKHCVENAPYSIDGRFLFPPQTDFEYLIQTDLNCDSLIQVQVEWIENIPLQEEYYICEGYWPFMHPLLGPIYESGPYTYPFYDQYLCDSSLTVKVNELIFEMDIRVPRNDLQCPGQTIVVDASYARVMKMPDYEEMFNVTYNWFRNGTHIHTGRFLNVTQAGNYRLLMVVNEFGLTCSEEFEFTIREFFDPPVVPQIQGPAQACPATQVVFTISNWDNRSVISAEDGDCFTIDSIVGNRIFIQINDVCADSVCVRVSKPNCPALFSRLCIPLTIRTSLELNITGDLIYCSGSETVLNSNQIFTNYLWNGPGGYSSTLSSIEVNTPGLYTLSVSDAQGCTGSANVIVEEIPLPNVNFAGSNAFCPGGFTTLEVTPSGMSEYIWTDGENTSVRIFDSPGTYTVMVIDPYGCESSGEITISMQDSLSPVISGDIGFCAGSSTILNGGAGFVLYEWNGISGTQFYQINTPGTVRLFVADASGCQGSTSIDITENPLPFPSYTLDKTGFCPNDFVEAIIIPSGMNRYQWSDGGTDRIRNLNRAGNYTITVTDSNNCSASVSFSINALPAPEPQISGDDYFCSGLSAGIQVNILYSSFLWSTGEQVQGIRVTNGQVYSVTVTDSNGCTGRVSKVVEEKINPVPTIGGDSGVCEGNTGRLFSVQDYANYQWSGPTVGSSKELQVSQSGLYTLVVTDNFGCIGSANYVFDVFTNPTPDISGSTTFCTGTATDLDGGIYQSYFWSGPAGFTANTRFVNINTPGTYGLIVSDNNGCTGSDEIQIEEDDELLIEIESPGYYCQDSSAIIEVEGNYSEYLWSNGSTEQTNQVQAGFYSVTVTDIYGCTGSAQTVVEEKRNPEPEIDGPLSFCTARGALLDAGVWERYFWSENNQTSQTIEVFVSGTYLVTVTDQFGCTGVSQIIVNEIEELQPTFTGNTGFCAGDSTSILVASGLIQYLWLDILEDTQQRVFYAPGTYTVMVEDDRGCTGSASVVIEEYALPMVDAGEDKELPCRDDQIIIGGSGTATGNVQYQWIHIPTMDVFSTSTPYFNTNREGDYILLITDLQTTCKNTDTVNVRKTTNFIIDADILSLNPSCHGDQNGFLEVLEVIGGTQPYMYTLNNNPLSGNSIGNLSPGNYSVLVTDYNGCTFRKTVQLINPEEVFVDAGPDQTIDFGERISIDPITNVSPSDLGQVMWIFNDDFICGSCPNINLRHEPNQSGNYIIIVADIHGCEASDTIKVTLVRNRNVFIPNAFTPDRNGINDRLNVFGGNDIESVLEFSIYDRWGSLVFTAKNLEPNDPSEGWDGTFRGMQLDPAVFICVVLVQFSDGERVKHVQEVNLLK
jgi:gliding motility-associated-like protein